MAISIRGRRETMHLNERTYESFLTLAKAFGWEPTGMALGENWVEHSGIRESAMKELGDWNVGYLTIDLQTVSEKDAQNIARALDEALKCIVLLNQHFTKEVMRALADSKPFSLLMEFVDEPEQELLRQFRRIIRHESLIF